MTRRNEYDGDSFKAASKTSDEGMHRQSDRVNAIRKLIVACEPDSNGKLREGLVETPLRAARAWAHWTSGYAIEPQSLLKTFEDGACDEMVVVCDIPVYSLCEHHLAPIFGRACIGYVPEGCVVGLSKIHRVVDVYARRLQTQERLTTQIAECLMKGLGAKGVGVILRCRHMCIESRGVAQQGSVTATNSLLGVFRDGVPRAEFFSSAKFEAPL